MGTSAGVRASSAAAKVRLIGVALAGAVVAMPDTGLAMWRAVLDLPESVRAIVMRVLLDSIEERDAEGEYGMPIDREIEAAERMRFADYAIVWIARDHTERGRFAIVEALLRALRLDVIEDLWDHASPESERVARALDLGLELCASRDAGAFERMFRPAMDAWEGSGAYHGAGRRLADDLCFLIDGVRSFHHEHGGIDSIPRIEFEGRLRTIARRVASVMPENVAQGRLVYVPGTMDDILRDPQIEARIRESVAQTAEDDRRMVATRAAVPAYADAAE
jgi:hypothetical protein